MLETSIEKFNQYYYMKNIQKLAFHLNHVHILGTYHCYNTHRDAFKRHAKFQDVLRRQNYDERVVASFANQIQSEYYGGNISVYIEGITLKHFRTIDTDTETLSHPCPTRHAVFHSILSDNRKQDADTTAAHSKKIIQFLKEIKFINAQCSTIW